MTLKRVCKPADKSSANIVEHRIIIYEATAATALRT